MIEQIARAGAEALRETTAGDTEAGIVDMHLRQERHRRRTWTGAVAAAFLVLGLGVAGGATLTHRASADLTPSNPGQQHSDQHCRAVLDITCLGHRTYRFPLSQPVQWRVPRGFGVASGMAVPYTVESYRDDGQGGVTVLEHVRASSPDGMAADTHVADSPRAFVRWVATRPYLAAGPVRTTTIDGHRAWQVRVSLKPGVPDGPARCTDRYRCYSMTYQPNGINTGIWGDQAAEYTAFELPGGGTTVVWSWEFGADPSHLSSLDAAVRGLSWP